MTFSPRKSANPAENPVNPPVVAVKSAPPPPLDKFTSAIGLVRYDDHVSISEIEKNKLLYMSFSYLKESFLFHFAGSLSSFSVHFSVSLIVHIILFV